MYFFEGTLNGVSKTGAYFSTGTAIDDNCGHSVSSTGDMNGDGLSGVMMGIPNYDLPGTPETGAVRVFDSAGNPYWLDEGAIGKNNPSNYFGWSEGGQAR